MTRVRDNLRNYTRYGDGTGRKNEEGNGRGRGDDAGGRATSVRIDREQIIYIIYIYFAVPDENEAAAANCRSVVITIHHCIATNTLEYVSPVNYI